MAVENVSNIFSSAKKFLGLEETFRRKATIEVGDGVMELELPEDVATVSKPPDGGKRAWLIVLACAMIRFCNALLVSLLNRSNGLCDASDKKATSQFAGSSIYDAFSDMSKLGTPIAAILMVRFGYRIVGLVGYGMLAAGLFVSSWISCDFSGFIGIFTGGVAGVGMSFVNLTAIVPVLEYFDKKRMRAIIAMRFAEILGGMIFLGISFLADSPDFTWRHIYRYQLILAFVASLACATLIPLKLKTQDNQPFVGKILGLSDLSFLKNLTLYLFMLIFFFDKIGRPLPSENMKAIHPAKEHSMEISFMPYVGDIIAIIGLYFWKNKTIAIVLSIMGCLDILSGILTLQAPYLYNYGWIIVYELIFGIATGVFESVVHNVIPKAFGKENTRIAIGLLQLAAGLGEIISSSSNDAFMKYKDDTGHKAAYNLAGSMLIIAGAASFVSRKIIKRQGHQKEHHTPSDDSEDDVEDRNDKENSSIKSDGTDRDDTNRVYVNTVEHDYQNHISNHQYQQGDEYYHSKTNSQQSNNSFKSNGYPYFSRPSSSFLTSDRANVVGGDEYNREQWDTYRYSGKVVGPQQQHHVASLSSRNFPEAGRQSDAHVYY